MIENYRPHTLGETKIPSSLELPPKIRQLIHSLEDGEWMNHQNGHWLDNRGALNSCPSVIVHQTQTEAISITGFVNNGDTWTEIFRSLSESVKLAGRKAEFDQIWKKLKETASSVTQNSDAFFSINNNSLLEPGSIIKFGLERLRLSQSIFTNDVALYGCTQHFSDLVSNKNHTDYISQRWEIWRSGFGVIRDVLVAPNNYCLFCYKKVC